MRISDWSSDVCSSDLAASRMASLLGETVGETVGYRMRLDNKISARTRIEVVTEGVFARMVLDDPDLASISAVLLDRKSVVLGKSVSVRVDLGGRRLIKTKKKRKTKRKKKTTNN